MRSREDFSDATAPVHNNMLLLLSHHNQHMKESFVIIKAGKLGDLLLEASGLHKAHKSFSDTQNSILLVFLSATLQVLPP